MRVRTIAAIAAILVIVAPTAALAGGPGSAAPKPRPPVFTPGSAGAGDPYFPLDGNGGYDVAHYDLAFTFEPATGKIDSVATITAVATQNLSSFDLDLNGLDVRSITVNRKTAAFSRSGQELIITPAEGIRNASSFTTVVRYSGVPSPLVSLALGMYGVVPSEDGVVIVGEPHSAATWFPVNDHPTDAASYSFEITVPAGLQAVANGVPGKTSSAGGWTTWTWNATDPMASYQVAVAIGEFEISTHNARGLKMLDAIDPDLFVKAFTIRDGTKAAYSGTAARSAYKRLTHVIDVPASGGTLAFDTGRDIESSWDFFFVEIHTVGADDWTTLPAYDDTGSEITSDDPGLFCLWENGFGDVHPFLAHYQTFSDDPSDELDPVCDPHGTTGEWHAATGASQDAERWNVDLRAYGGRSVEVSLTYMSDAYSHGVMAIDDVVVSTGQGTTSFEDDGDPLDGWTVSGPPDGSPGNTTDWTTVGQDALPESVGTIASQTFAREPEILTFLSDEFGPYPFKTAGAIVDDGELAFAIETQTRPVYARVYFKDPAVAASAVIHELAHQWFGNSLRLARWQDLWLNEGFAVYAEWLWSEHEGGSAPQDYFDDLVTSIAPDDDWWQLAIGDPGTDDLFDGQVYDRGALTLHALRLRVGDTAFFRILQTWTRTKAGQTVTTPEFIALAETISHQDLDEFFEAWLYTAGYPSDAIAGAQQR
ncbi:MAG TPA: M1 family aminopeptidase [Candidatus Limnocylindrales bacterium]|nr:M1 family aminopeptidase [Candidatus Limnocylindrales bacterium]